MKLICEVIFLKSLLALILSLFMLGSGGNVKNVVIHEVSSDIYSQEEISAAAQTVLSEFARSWSGCTLIISITKVVLAKLAAVGLALLLNECHTSWYRRMVQTVSYMPHFLSWVVIYGITYLLCSESSGYINRVLRYFDSPTVSILTSNSAFRPMLYITHIWKGTGFSSIIYLATMTSIDPTLYEAAQVDGAGRLQRIWHITLPGIRSTFVMLCIISAGSIMNAGFDQVYVFYNELVYETGDIIDTYVYRVGLEDMRFGLSTAVGLFKNVIGFILVFSTNKIAQHWGEGIW